METPLLTARRLFKLYNGLRRNMDRGLSLESAREDIREYRRQHPEDTEFLRASFPSGEISRRLIKNAAKDIEDVLYREDNAWLMNYFNSFPPPTDEFDDPTEEERDPAHVGRGFLRGGVDAQLEAELERAEEFADFFQGQYEDLLDGLPWEQFVQNVEAFIQENPDEEDTIRGLIEVESMNAPAPQWVANVAEWFYNWMDEHGGGEEEEEEFEEPPPAEDVEQLAADMGNMDVEDAENPDADEPPDADDPMEGNGRFIRMPKSAFIKEHKHLLKVLKSGDPKQLAKEYRKQKKELKGGDNTLRIANALFRIAQMLFMGVGSSGVVSLLRANTDILPGILLAAGGTLGAFLTELFRRYGLRRATMPVSFEPPDEVLVEAQNILEDPTILAAVAGRDEAARDPPRDPPLPDTDPLPPTGRGFERNPTLVHPAILAS